MLVTMVGNYPKVAEDTYGTKLIGTLGKWQRRELSDDQLEALCRDLTRAVIKEQEAAGLDLLTDGQIRWEDLVTPIARGLQGFEINGLTRWFNNNVYYRRPVLIRPPVWTRPILVEDYRFAAGCTKKSLKAVLPGPYSFVKLSEDRYFKSERRFVLKMAELLNQEARALERAGAAFIQFDEPALCLGKPDAALAIRGLGEALRGLRATTAVVTYFGPPDGCLPALERSAATVIGIDVVSEPKGAVAALRRLRTRKALALGCVDARNTKLESMDDLRELIRLARTVVPDERLYVSPNCGLEFLPHEQALAKLRRLAQAAGRGRRVL
jgi:5-methyltetrahydropteroyltriglutamate--homocysteine methyltransferase